MGDCGTACHIKWRHRRREKPVARAVAAGVLKESQGVTRPAVLERPVHAEPHIRKLGHHLAPGLAHLGKGQPTGV